MSEKDVYNAMPMQIENLKYLLKKIAAGHATEISKEATKNSINKREFNIVPIARKLLTLKLFDNDNIDEDTIIQKVEALETSVKSVLESSILVRDQGIKNLVPPPYEFLSLIFLSTDEQFRQHYFHDLTDFYYQELCESVKTLSTTHSYKKVEFEEQVKVLLPVVKFETAAKLVQGEDLQSEKLLKEVILNLVSYLNNPRLNQEDIYAVISTKIGSKNYKLVSYDMVALDERNGHLGDYFKLNVVIQFEKSEKVFNFFAKFLTPKLEKMQELVRSGPSKKEEFFYMTYLPLLEKYGLGSLLDFSPKCYLSRLNDVLILDDMIAEGFTSLTPNIKLEFDGLSCVVKKIAKFHACSFSLQEILNKQEDNAEDLYETYKEYFQEVLFQQSKDSMMKDTFKTTEERMIYIIEKFPELTKNISKDIFKEKIALGWKLLFKQVSMSVKHKNTICHGDMYVGNMLFKFNSEGICEDATLVDFQILRYCPPVHDLLFFIYLNSFKNIRDKHCKQLVEEYYSCLSKQLNKCGFDIVDIYPENEFQESLKYMKSQAIFHSFFYSFLNMLNPRTREEMFQNPEMSKKYFYGDQNAIIDLGMEDEDYRKSFAGLIEDLVDLIESDEL